MVLVRDALPAAEEQAPFASLSRRQFKRLRQPRFGLFNRASQSHPKGVRGSRTEIAPGTLDVATALIRLRGRRTKLRIDHSVVATWIEGVTAPPGLSMHLNRMLAPLRPTRDLVRRLEATDDGALTVSEEWVGEALNSKSGQRNPLVRLVRRHLQKNAADVESALITVLRLALGHAPVWDGTFRRGGEGEDLSLEATLVKALGLARPAEDDNPSAQPLLRCDPATVPETLGVIKKLGGITGIAELVVSGKAALTDEEWALGRGVVHAFTSNAAPIMRAAAFRFGRQARRAGSIHSVFEPFGLISLNRRGGARLAGLMAVGIALVVRVMLARKMVTRHDIDVVLGAVRSDSSPQHFRLAVTS